MQNIINISGILFFLKGVTDMETTKKKKTNTVKKTVIIICAVIAVIAAAVAVAFFGEAKTLLSISGNEEKGIYNVNYYADYKLDELLEAGGVQTEEELAQYIIKVIAKGLPVNIDYDVPQLACSTFMAEKPDGGFIFGRNLDNQQTDLAVVRTEPKNAYSSVSVVNLSFLGYSEDLKPTGLKDRIKMLATPYFPLDGVNEKGLAVGVLQIQAPPTHQDNGMPDVDTTLAIRMLLDNAADVGEAVDILRRYDMHASANGCYHLQIADAKGNSVVVSYVGNEMIVTEKEKEYLCATNFYLHDVPFEYEKQGIDRYDKLIEKLSESKGVLSAQDGMKLLDYVRIDSTEPDEEGRVYSTQWSSIYDLNSPSLTICVDKNYDESFFYSVK